MIVIGAVGIGLTVARSLTVHRAPPAVALLGAATGVLLVALILTANAF